MVQWVKHLPQEPEDWSLNPQCSSRCCVSTSHRKGGDEILWTGDLARLTKWNILPQNIKYRVMEDDFSGKPLDSTCMYTQTHTNVPTYMWTFIHICNHAIYIHKIKTKNTSEKSTHLWVGVLGLLWQSTLRLCSLQKPMSLQFWSLSLKSAC